MGRYDEVVATVGGDFADQPVRHFGKGAVVSVEMRIVQDDRPVVVEQRGRIGRQCQGGKLDAAKNVDRLCRKQAGIDDAVPVLFPRHQHPVEPFQARLKPLGPVARAMRDVKEGRAATRQPGEESARPFRAEDGVGTTQAPRPPHQPHRFRAVDRRQQARQGHHRDARQRQREAMRDHLYGIALGRRGHENLGHDTSAFHQFEHQRNEVERLMISADRDDRQP